MKQVEFILSEFENGSYGVLEAINKLFDLPMGKTVILEQCKLYLDKQIDPNFDVKELPSLNIEPPIETGLRSGVSVDSIKNPQQKAEYQKLILKNKKQSNYYLKQIQLRKLLTYLNKSQLNL